MKKFKAILWGIIVIFLVLVYFQNRGFFETKNSLMLDLYITDAWQSPELVTAVWVLGALVVGFLIAYFFSLVEKFRINKLNKVLRARVQSQEEKIDKLKKEIESHTGFKREDTINSEVVGSSSLPEATEAPSVER